MLSGLRLKGEPILITEQVLHFRPYFILTTAKMKHLLWIKDLL
jgi:hypothetical protein